MKSKVVLCKLVEDNKRFSIEQPLASIALAVEEYVPPRRAEKQSYC